MSTVATATSNGEPADNSSFPLRQTPISPHSTTMANTIPVVTQTQTPPSSPPAATRATFVESDFYILGYKRTLVCIGLSLVLFISALDSSIVSVALPIIGAEFDDYTESSWIVTSYLITYTAFLPIVSKFTDILGRRPVLVWSCLFFMVRTLRPDLTEIHHLIYCVV